MPPGKNHVHTTLPKKKACCECKMSFSAPSVSHHLQTVKDSTGEGAREVAVTEHLLA